MEVKKGDLIAFAVDLNNNLKNDQFAWEPGSASARLAARAERQRGTPRKTSAARRRSRRCRRGKSTLRSFSCQTSRCS
jgi:hypothetical protein